MRIPFNKPFRIFIIALLSTITLIVLTSAIVSLFYEKAVIRYMKKYLDEHLLTQISTDDIRFSALKGFPNATVDINRVVVLSGAHFSPGDFKAPYADTLLKARKVSFRFDLIMLFNKNYELKKVEITDGFVNILFDKKGEHNLRVWKTGEPAGKDSYSLNLQSITVSDMIVRWTDLRNRINFTSFTGKTSFRGTYAKNILAGDAHGIFSKSSLLVHNEVYMKKADVEVQLKMIYTADRFRVPKALVKINRAEINLVGEYRSGLEKQIELSMEVPKFGLAEVISLLPVQSDSLFKRYHFTGGGSMKATLKGPVSDPDHLHIRSEFTLKDCSARNLKTRSMISHIDLKGEISGTHAANFKLILDHFTSTLGKGNIHGNLQITNLHDLMLHANITSDVDLGALQSFLGLQGIQQLGGMIQSSFNMEGKLGRIRRDSAVQLMEYLKSGTFVFQDAGIKLKNREMTLEHISGKAILNKIFYLEQMSIRINDNDLRLDGKVQNLNAYLLEKGILISDLTISTDQFSMYTFLRYQPSGSGSKKRERVVLFPARMFLNATIHAGLFEAGKFSATQATASLTLIGDSMYIHTFSLKFPNGTISGDALVSQNRDHLLSVTCNSVPNKINIQQLFTSFNNFTQKFIVDKNVKGSLNGKISFFAQWDSTLRFIPKSLKAKGDLEITEGELVEFEPMMKLSKYISVDELRLIRFKTLRNEIYIKDRLVTIPEMAIHSSAFNISVSGHQTFDNLFEYRMNVLLSEVLFNKARKKKKEMDEFMVVENSEDQTTIPLILAGTPDNFEVRFDRKKAFSFSRKKTDAGSKIPDADNFKIDWDDKKETIIQKPPANQTQDDFKIEWDEDDKSEQNDL